MSSGKSVDTKENLPADPNKEDYECNVVQHLPCSYPIEVNISENIGKPDKNSRLKKKNSFSKFIKLLFIDEKHLAPVNPQEESSETELETSPERKVEITNNLLEGEPSFTSESVSETELEAAPEEKLDATDFSLQGETSFTSESVREKRSILNSSSNDIFNEGEKKNVSNKIIKDQNYFISLGSAFDKFFYNLYSTNNNQILSCEEVMEKFMKKCCMKEAMLKGAKQENEDFRKDLNLKSEENKDLNNELMQVKHNYKMLHDKYSSYKTFLKKAEDTNLKLQIALDLKTESFKKEHEHNIDSENKLEEAQTLLMKKETLLQEKDKSLEENKTIFLKYEEALNSKEQIIQNWLIILSLYFEQTTGVFQVIHHLFKPLIDSKTRIDFKHTYGKLLKVIEESCNLENPHFDKIDTVMDTFFTHSFFEDIKDLDAKKYIQMSVKQAESDHAEKEKLRNQMKLQRRMLTEVLEKRYMPEIDDDKIRNLLQTSASLV